MNNQFAYDSLLSVHLDKQPLDNTIHSLEQFCQAFGAKIKDSKSEYWMIGAESLPDGLSLAWKHILDGEIMWYLGIPFRKRVSVVDMW